MIVAGVYSRLIRLKTWQRLTLAMALGGASTLAMPPWHMVFVLWIAIPALLWMLEGCRTTKEAAALGWSFGFGHFVVGLNWIANAFYVDADTHGVFAIPAVGALCAIFGLYIAVVTALVHRIPHDSEAPPYDSTPTAAVRAFVFALAWASLEWIRGWLFTGFPWNPISAVWTAWPTMIQSTSLIGTLGLSLLTVMAAAAFAVLGPRWRLKSTWLIAIGPSLVLVLLGGFGLTRLNLATVEMTPGVNLRLVQPNIPQADKWRPGLREQHFMDHVRLSAGTGIENITHVIWGEAAVAYALDRDDGRRAIATAALQPHAALITGAPRAAVGQGGLEQIFNSLLVIDAHARVTAIYDKTHLVPFGEYIPLRWLVPFRKLTEGTMDFSPGVGRTTIAVEKLPPFSPLICYEAIFTGAVTGPDAEGNQRPLWLLNLTNDSWFGDSSGPRQHLASAQLRAVEEGLPLIRVANTGISAVIDPYGRILGQIPLGVRGTLDSGLPQALRKATIYNSAGQIIPLAMIVMGILGVMIFWRRHIRHN